MDINFIRIVVELEHAETGSKREYYTRGDTLY